MSEKNEEQPLFVVAILTVVAGAVDRFREFEARAARIVARHGGVLERTIAVESPMDAAHREVHLLRFPSKDAFARYRTDAELASLAELRAAAIAHTEILVGREAGEEHNRRMSCGPAGTDSAIM